MRARKGAGLATVMTDCRARKICVDCDLDRKTFKASLRKTQAYRLHYGSAQRPLAEIVPDLVWHDMFRIAWPDGQLSDMCNLSRARDAAVAIAERGPPARDRLRLTWRKAPIEDATGASLVAANADWVDWPPSEGGET
jgi:hypothetical protein